MATQFAILTARRASKFFTKDPIVEYINISKRWGTAVALVNAVGNTMNWLVNSEDMNIPDPLTGIAYSYAKGFCYGALFPLTIPLATLRLSMALAEQDEKWLFPILLPRWRSADPKYSFKDPSPKD